MDEKRLISLWNEYQSKRDTYTPEQQEAMENKFGDLVQKAMAEKEDQIKEESIQQPNQQIQRYAKAEKKPYRVSL